jgi:transposase
LTIPAIGKVVSREMLSVLHSRQFERASQVAAFIGVVPKLHESGKLKGRTTLSKQGSGRIRAKLYMAAVVAIQHNPDIKNQYERLLKAGKTKMQALGAAMRKLVQICFGVLKHQSEYRPQITN